MDYKIRLTLWLIVIFIIVNCITVVSAASVNIWPIDPIIEYKDNTTSLWLENLDKQDILLQIRIYSWKQKNNNFLLKKQNDILVSPPIVLIKSHHKQLIRLVKIINPLPYEERSYRIIIDEIPRLNDLKDINQQKNKLKLQIRYSIPFFGYGPNIQSSSNTIYPLDNNLSIFSPKLHYYIINKNNKQYLHIRNDGYVHAKLSEVDFKDKKNQYLMKEEFLGYILPGNEISFPISQSLTGSEILTARINNQEKIQTIPFFISIKQQ
ncbi:MAG: fimbria/pilus periplasmic chaperone [Candidatus Dasytiphilus stammeri]